MMPKIDFAKKRGCTHKERPKTQKCANCGAGLCYECAFDAEVGSRITRRTSVDQEVQADYAIFCPACFLEWITEKGYGPVEKPGLISSIFDAGLKYNGRYGGAIYLGLTLFLTPMIIGLMLWWAAYDTLQQEYKKHQKAFSLLMQGSPAG